MIIDFMGKTAIVTGSALRERRPKHRLIAGQPA